MTATATLLTALLPWARTGRHPRTGVDLVRVSRSLHLATRLQARALLAAVCAAPFVLAAGWIAWAFRRDRIARLLAALTGTVGVVAAAVLATSSLAPLPGAAAGAVLGALTLALAVGHWGAL